MKDILVIIRRNFISPIVIAILVLAGILLLLNEVRDAWFISVVILVNTFLAIIQEVRAQRALKKLELMNAPYAHVIRSDGSLEDIMFDKLVIGDIVKLDIGDEIPADGKIISCSGLEVDESILTGESASIDKSNGKIVYAASSVVAGSATMCVMAIGTETKVGSMTVTLKRYKPQLTPIQQAIARAITWLTYGALGLAVLIFIVYYLSGEDAVQIFKTITSAAVTVVPEGLLLASSLLLAFGSLRLAQAKVLPQKLAAIEAMALLDVLCIDKTGTLTSDEISFEDFEIFDASVSRVSDMIGVVAAETGGGSKTNSAIADKFTAPKQYKVLQTLSFSSVRKMSGVKVMLGRKVYSVLVGAPEYLGRLTDVTDVQKQRIEALASIGKRVLLVAVFDDVNISLKDVSVSSGRAVGIIVLANELRDGVKKTVSYLQKNGVSLRVISGDSPNTVQYIAKQAGINGSKNILTGEKLQQINDVDWDKIIAGTNIFARVLPEQKERIIETYKRLGNFSGMVGDGVNDALALKKSDLGVAMFSGAAATRRVADIVLLNNSFNSLPLGMRLGNRIMQTIELIAVLFFNKIIYGVILLLSTLAVGLVYPFGPRHITFMNIFLVTMPTIMWALFTPSPRHRISPLYFWRDTLRAVAPISILTGLTVTLTYIILQLTYPADPLGVSTTTVIVSTFFGIYMVFLVPKMFEIRNNKAAKFANIFYVVSVLLVLIPSFQFSFARDFFDFTTPAWQNNWFLLVLIISVAVLQWIIAKKAGAKTINR